MTSVRLYLLLVIILLCISIINNVVMYYKCYVNSNTDNSVSDVFVPANVGVYRINVYYNKHRYPEVGIGDEIKPEIKHLDDMLSRTINHHRWNTNRFRS
jgi:hypothetical protein